MLRGNADAGIAHGKADSGALAGPLGAKRHLAAAGVAYRVLDEILQYLPCRRAVSSSKVTTAPPVDNGRDATATVRPCSSISCASVPMPRSAFATTSRKAGSAGRAETSNGVGSLARSSERLR